LLLLYKYKREHLRVIPCNLHTLKHFAELLALVVKGHLEEKPTEDIMRGYMRRFTSGYKRDTGICILKQIRKTATNVSVTSRDYYYLLL